MKPKVAIIILNWNGWNDTLECLESLYQIKYKQYIITLIDNHSEDDSIDKIREYCKGEIKINSSFIQFSKNNKPINLFEFNNDELRFNDYKDQGILNPSSNKLLLIKNDKNYGFAEGNNIAIRFLMEHMKPEYILLLNNDTIVDPKFLNELINIAENEAKIGIVGPKLLNAYNPKIIDSTGHIIKWGRIIDRGNGEVDNNQYDAINEVIGGMAAAVLYKSQMLQDVGLFDPTFETLYEDADLSWRAHNKGWMSIYAPKSVVYHKRGKSIAKKNLQQKMNMLCTKNMVRSLIKNGNFIQKTQFMLVLLKSSTVIIISRIIGRNQVNLYLYFKMIYKSYSKIMVSFYDY